METITLTFASLGIETMAGIPEFVEIVSNIPAMIFYTLDGTLPTMLSSQYSSYVQMPTDSGSVTLSAVAYFLDGYQNLVPSSVMTQTYFTDSSETGSFARRLNFAGVVYIYPGGLNIPFWYDSSGEASVFIDIEKEELEGMLIPSERNADGSYRTDVPGGVVSLVPASETPSRLDDSFVMYSNPTNDPVFDPTALYIVIDGRNTRNLDTINLTNGPNMSLRDSERYLGGIDLRSTDGSNYNSGSGTKIHYNRERNIVVFYYFDTNANRWIKSIQRLENMVRTSPPNSVITTPCVFAWNEFGRHQGM